MSISERVEYSTLLSFMVMFWICSVYDYFDRGRIFLPLLVFRFGVYFSYLEGRVEYSSLWYVIITEYKSRKENPQKLTQLSKTVNQ